MHANNRRSILAMSLGMALFIANDALVKQVSTTLPGPQLIFIRGLMATTLVLIMAQAMGHLKKWRLMLNTRLWIRGSVDAVASLAYLTAVFHLPLGNATAINLSSPLFITLFAVVCFKEQVRLQRALLIFCSASVASCWWFNPVQTVSMFTLGQPYWPLCCMPRETHSHGALAFMCLHS